MKISNKLIPTLKSGLVKSVTSSIAILTVFASAHSYSNDKVKTIKNQVEIFEDVLRTAVRKASDSEGFRLGQIRSFYLANQGAVFEMSLNSRSSFQYFIPEVPAVPEVERIERIEQIEMSDSLEETVRKAEIIAREALREVEFEAFDDFAHFGKSSQRQEKDLLRQKREMVREINSQIREANAERSRLKWDIQNAEKDNKKGFEKELSRTESKLKELRKEKRKLEDDYNQSKQAYKDKIKQSEKKRLVAQQKSLAKIEAVLSNTLCSFGAGLRSIPDNENVNIILTGVGNNGKQDKVIVLKRKTIMDCVIGKTKESALLTNNNSYFY